MTSQLEALKTNSSDLEPFNFRTNLMLLGYMAHYYSNYCSDAPIRHWGEKSGLHALRIGNDEYRIGRQTRGGIGGMTIWKTVDRYNGGSDVVHVWIPWSEFERLQWSVSGVAL